MSSKQGNSDKNCGDCGYDAGNQRHEEKYWEGRSDPRDKDGILKLSFQHYIRFLSKSYFVIRKGFPIQ